MPNFLLSIGTIQIDLEKLYGVRPDFQACKDLRNHLLRRAAQLEKSKDLHKGLVTFLLKIGTLAYRREIVKIFNKQYPETQWDEVKVYTANLDDFLNAIPEA